MCAVSDADIGETCHVLIIRCAQLITRPSESLMQLGQEDFKGYKQSVARMRAPPRRAIEIGQRTGQSCATEQREFYHCGVIALIPLPSCAKFYWNTVQSARETSYPSPQHDMDARRCVTFGLLRVIVAKKAEKRP